MDIQSAFEKICRPVFNNTPLTGLYYLRILNKAEYIALCTIPEWVEYKIENHLTIFAPLPNKNLPKQYYHLVPQIGDELHCKTIEDGKKLFQIFYPLDIFLQNKNYQELFSFAIDTDTPDVIHWYFNNQPLFTKILDYLQPEINKLVSNNYHKILKSDDPSKLPVPDQLIDSNTENSLPLSKRELDCLELLAKGYSSKKIAQNLNISFRTVEKHLENIKIKLNCNTKDQLIQIVENKIFTFSN